MKKCLKINFVMDAVKGVLEMSGFFITVYLKQELTDAEKRKVAMRTSQN